MNRFLDRPLDYTRTPRTASDAARYACPVQSFPSAPMHRCDRIVVVASVLAILALALILFLEV